MYIAAQGHGVTITAMRFPPCNCGVPYGHHKGGPTCQGYSPTEPVENLGTRAFSPPRSLAWWRRVASLACWAVEYRVQNWRERLVRRRST